MAKKVFTVKTKYGSFKCIFEREKDMGGYVAETPDVQGAVSWGKTLVDAKKKVAEAIEGAVEAHAIVAAEKKGIVRMVKSSRHSVPVA
ncbi:MAG: type II toxin-antitoxin system HicB family antitoxin [Parcubacteria group bacterium]|nr:type II toxin-antitoxin system HicB family antitoxin [Parcubacteria group bacterium]